MSGKVLKEGLIYPELSYQIIGCAYDVFNSIGPGHSEKIYQKSLSVSLDERQLKYSEQVYYDLKFKGKTVGKGFLDFLVDEKIIIEIKKDEFFSKTNIEQVLNYLQLSGLKLAILINFTKTGVKFKRIPNINAV